jgi:hypothetical protein
VHRRPPDPPMSSSCRGPKFCDIATTYCVNQSISAWEKPNPSLYKCEGGSQGPSPSSNNLAYANVYMMKGDAFISTRAHDYNKPSTSEKGKEAELPSLPLQIEKTLGETMTRIPKGTFKKDSHNPNARACPELFCGGGFVTNPLCDVLFGGPPKLPFPEESLVNHFRIYRDL